MADQPDFLISQDGSHTLKSNQFNVTYHSIHGAIHESITVFLSAGFQYLRSQGLSEISILEIGFGTGLNAFLTIIESIKYKVKTHYIGIEKHPLPWSTVSKLNYVDILDCENALSYYEGLHKAEWGKPVTIHEFFSIDKKKADITSVSLNSSIDLIYYDAFGPSSQPELWTSQVMRKCHDLLSKGGVLVTYCAQGEFKRSLKEVGFTVEELPGPPGKRQMTRAIKS